MDISALNHTCHEGRFLGVLGGMGPMAGASFMARLVALSNADCDQQHLPAILWSDPRIPGRSKGYAKLGPDPLPWMMYGVNRLVSMGAGAIAIPCNTAHLWYEQISAAVQVPVLHIVQAVIDDLRRQDIHQGCVGLMGTSATLRLGLYQRALEKNAYRWMVPTETEIADYCSASIALVGANRIAEALKPAAECVSILKSRGADVVVLGCTELPLALPHPIRPGLGIPIVDSIDALALTAMDWY